MTTNILASSVDLDTLFAAHVTSNALYATGYQVGGVDIQTRFDTILAPAQANLGARIPAINIKTSAPSYTANTDLASIFAGHASQYSLTTPANSTATQAGFLSPTVLTDTITVTFASAAALTNYFNFGGRLLLSCSQSAGTAADAALAAMFSSMGTLTIYDAGHFSSGTGTNTNTAFGGSNIGTTPVAFYTTTDGSPYTGTTYAVTVVANGAIGSATALTITTVLTVNISGTIQDTYTGTYTSVMQQRNHPTQAVPTFASTITAPTITYSITPAAGSVNEGSPLTFNVTTTNFGTGNLYWTVPTSGTAVAADFVATSGTVAITGNVGSFTVTPTADAATEGPETFTASLRTVSTAGSIVATSSSVTINDTSTAATVNITVVSNVANFNIYNNRLASQHGAAVVVSGTYATNATINVTVNSGVTVYSASNAAYAMDTGTGWLSGVVINLTNNGYIAGNSGAAGPTAGGAALNARYPVTINNTTGYIYSGGGGGGWGGPGWTVWYGSTYTGYGSSVGGGIGGQGAGALYGIAGANGVAGGSAGGGAGGAGGGGGAIGVAGGAGVANVAVNKGGGGGGGGGGGASGGVGGAGYRGPGSAGAGHGLAINTNNNTITWTGGQTRVYGGIANDTFTASYTLAANTYNANLYSIVTSLGWNQLAPVAFTFTVNSGVLLTATSSSIYALTTGIFPAGSVITIVNNGYIAGTGASGAGGPAMLIQYPVSINNGTGYIYSGGGGGGNGAGLTATSWNSGNSTTRVNHYGFVPGGNGAPAGNVDKISGAAGANYVGLGGAGGALGANGAPGAANGGGGGGGGGGGASGGAGAAYPGYSGNTVGSGHGLAISTGGNTITWISGQARTYGGIV
jgi:hypothetical protein